MTIAMVYYAKNRKMNFSSEPKSDPENTKLDEDPSNEEENPESNPMIIPKNFQIQNNKLQ